MRKQPFNLKNRIVAFFLAVLLCITNLQGVTIAASSVETGLQGVLVEAAEDGTSIVSETANEEVILSETGEDSDTVFEVGAEDAGTFFEGDEPKCGKKEHQHTKDCYAVKDVQTLDCPYKDSRDVIIHVHDEKCYENGKLICTLTETPEVEIEETFVTEEEETILGTDANTFGKPVKRPLSEKAHLVSEDEKYSAYKEEGIDGLLVYEGDMLLPHVHGIGCYDQDGKLICDKAQSVYHQHGKDCFKEKMDQNVLICGLEEHLHTAACYEEQGAQEDQQAAGQQEITATGSELFSDELSEALEEGAEANLENDGSGKENEQGNAPLDSVYDVNDELIMELLPDEEAEESQEEQQQQQEDIVQIFDDEDVVEIFEDDAQFSEAESASSEDESGFEVIQVLEDDIENEENLESEEEAEEKEDKEDKEDKEEKEDEEKEEETSENQGAGFLLFTDTPSESEELFEELPAEEAQEDTASDGEELVGEPGEEIGELVAEVAEETEEEEEEPAFSVEESDNLVFAITDDETLEAASEEGSEELADAFEATEDTLSEESTGEVAEDDLSMDWAAEEAQEYTSGQLDYYGENYRVRLTYGEDAKLPQDAYLKVEEVVGDEEYLSYLTQAKNSLGVENVENARFFDIKIMAEEETEEGSGEETGENLGEAIDANVGGELEEEASEDAPQEKQDRAVQPEANVKVEIFYDNQKFGEDVSANVLHFGSKVDVLDLAEVGETASEFDMDETVAAGAEGSAVAFMVDSFSVFGVIYTVESYYTSASGETYKITISFDAESGIPENAQVEVAEIAPEDPSYTGYIEQTANVLGLETRFLSFARPFDIKLVNPETGEHYQPSKNVKVSITLLDQEMESNGAVKIIHFAENENGSETVAQEIDCRVSGEAVEFETDGFSVYVVASEELMQHYVFLNDSDGGLTESNKDNYIFAEQVLINGEQVMIPPDPARDGAVFSHWSEIKDGENSITFPVDVIIDKDNVKELAIEDHPNATKQEKQQNWLDHNPTYYYAVYANHNVVVTFYNQSGLVVQKVNLLKGGDNLTESDEDYSKYYLDTNLDKYDYIPIQDKPNAYVAFEHWTTEKYTTTNSANVNTLHYALTDPTTSVDLYPVLVEGHYLNFDSNKAGAGGNSASFVPSLFVKNKDYTGTETEIEKAEALANDIAKAMNAGGSDSVPVVAGYNFLGWYLSADGIDTEPVFNYENGTFTANKVNGEVVLREFGLDDNGRLQNNPTLYARWEEEKKADYTIVVWFETVKSDKNAALADKKFAYKGSHQVTNATVGSVPGTKTNDGIDYADPDTYESDDLIGFMTDSGDIQIVKSSDTVKADGSTIVNIYFLRKTIIYTFKIYGDTYTKVNSVNDRGPYTVYTESGGVYTEQSLHYNTDDKKWYTEYSRRRFGGNCYETVYEKTQGWSDHAVFTGLFGQTLGQNNHEWDYQYDWYTAYETNWYDGKIKGSGTHTTFLDAFLPDPIDKTFYGFTPDGGSSTISFYKQIVDESTGKATNNYNLAHRINTTPSGFNITDKYNGYKAYEYSVDNGTFRNVGKPYVNNGTTIYGNPVSYNKYLDIRFELKDYKLSVKANGGHIKEPGSTNTLSQEEFNDVPYTAKLDKHIPSYLLPSYIEEHPDTVLSRPGYKFTGWCLDENGKEIVDLSSYEMPADDLVLYAGWEKIKYQVYIVPNGGELGGYVENAVNTYSTNFRVERGKKISEYKDITRDYIYVGEGQGSYAYAVSYDKEDDTGKRCALYVQNPAEASSFGSDIDTNLLTLDYKPQEGAYVLQGWYEATEFENGDRKKPTKDNYGQYKTRDYPFVFSTPVEADVTLVAKWRRASGFYVRYDIKDTDLGTNVSYDGIQIPQDNEEYIEGAHALVLPSLGAPQGYALDHWEDKNGNAYAPNELIPIVEQLGDLSDSKMIITLKAKYRLYTPTERTMADYTFLTRKVKEGAFSGTDYGIYETQRIAVNEELKAPITPEVPTGYEFTGWYYDKEGTRRFDGFGVIAHPTYTTLYAVYKKVYTVNYYMVNVQTGIPTDMILATQTYAADGSEELDTRHVEHMADPDHYVSGWRTFTKNGDNYSYGDKIYDYAHVSNEKVIENMNLCAVIEKRLFVRFNSHGGSYVDSQEIITGGKPVRPDNPTRTGYTFQGWFKDEVGGTAYNFKEKWSTYAGNPTSDGWTLHAHWTVDGNRTAEVTVIWWVQSTEGGDKYEYSSKASISLPVGTYINISKITSNITDAIISEGNPHLSGFADNEKKYLEYNSQKTEDQYSGTEGILLEDEGCAFNIYFTRKKYTLRFKTNNNGVIHSKNLKYSNNGAAASDGADAAYYEIEVWLNKKVADIWPIVDEKRQNDVQNQKPWIEIPSGSVFVTWELIKDDTNIPYIQDIASRGLLDFDTNSNNNNEDNIINLTLLTLPPESAEIVYIHYILDHVESKARYQTIYRELNNNIAVSNEKYNKDYVYPRYAKAVNAMDIEGYDHVIAGSDSDYTKIDVVIRDTENSHNANGQTAGYQYVQVVNGAKRYRSEYVRGTLGAASGEETTYTYTWNSDTKYYYRVGFDNYKELKCTIYNSGDKNDYKIYYIDAKGNEQSVTSGYVYYVETGNDPLDWAVFTNTTQVTWHNFISNSITETVVTVPVGNSGNGSPEGIHLFNYYKIRKHSIFLMTDAEHQQHIINNVAYNSNVPETIKDYVPDVPEGLKFVCWSSVDGEAEEYTGNMPDKDLYLYMATIPEAFTVTTVGIDIEGNGFEVNDNDQPVDSNNVNAVYTYKGGTSYPITSGTKLKEVGLPSSPTMSGTDGIQKVFIGWQIKKENGSFEDVTSNYSITDNVVLYPKWYEERFHKVEYYSNFGSYTGEGPVPEDRNNYSVGAKVVIKDGKSLSIKRKNVDNNEYVASFAYWNTKSDGSGQSYFPGNTFVFYEDTKDDSGNPLLTLKLYAIYSEYRESTLRYDKNADEAIYIKDDGSGDVYTTNTIVTVLFRDILNSEYPDSFKKKPNEAFPIGEDESNNKFTVSRKENGNIYYFAGWATERNATVPFAQNGDIAYVNTIREQDLNTLYAIWAICKVEDKNGIYHYFDTLTQAVNFVKTSTLVTNKTGTIEMLIDYTMPSGDAVEIPSDCNVTLTSATTGKTYSGSSAKITRGYDGGSMFTVNGGLTLADSNGGIVLDGNKDSKKSTTNGGLVNVASGATLNINSSAVLQNSKSEAAGGAVYVADNGTMKMNGGTITGNTSTNGGAVDVGGINSKLYFSGEPTVSNNINDNDGKQKNIVLSVNSDSVIQAEDGLTGGNIGVYVADAQKDTYGKKGQSFGGLETGIDADKLSAFKNDRDSSLYGTQGEDVNSGKIVWVGNDYVCKIVDSSNQEHLFKSIKAALEYARNNGLASNVNIQMLKDYTIGSNTDPDHSDWGTFTDNVEVASGENITITTATEGEHRYTGSGNKATITRGYTGESLFIVGQTSIHTTNPIGSHQANTNGKLSLSGLIIDGNSGSFSNSSSQTEDKGGGIVYAQEGSNLDMTNCVVCNSKCTDAAKGGAVLINGNSTVNITSCEFSGNEINGSGGAIASQRTNGAPSTINITDSTFTNNKTVQNGGAIRIYGGTTLNMSGCTVNSGNSAVNGSAVYVESADSYPAKLNLTGGTISGNTATSGGAIGFSGTNSELNLAGDVTITGNTKGTGTDPEVCNIYLDQDSDTVIKTTGLGENALVGVYVPSTAITTGSTETFYDKHGDSFDSFGTFDNTVSGGTDKEIASLMLTNLVNDTNQLVGVARTDGVGEKKIIWMKLILLTVKKTVTNESATGSEEFVFTPIIYISGDTHTYYWKNGNDSYVFTPGQSMTSFTLKKDDTKTLYLPGGFPIDLTETMTGDTTGEELDKYVTSLVDGHSGLVNNTDNQSGNPSEYDTPTVEEHTVKFKLDATKTSASLTINNEKLITLTYDYGYKENGTDISNKKLQVKLHNNDRHTVKNDSRVGLVLTDWKVTYPDEVVTGTNGTTLLRVAGNQEIDANTTTKPGEEIQVRGDATLTAVWKEAVAMVKTFDVTEKDGTIHRFLTQAEAEDFINTYNSVAGRTEEEKLSIANDLSTKENLFATLADTMDFIRGRDANGKPVPGLESGAMNTTTPATIQMLSDYEMTEKDAQAMVIKEGENITLTTAAPAGDGTNGYKNETDSSKKTATITRKISDDNMVPNTSSMFTQEGGTLTFSGPVTDGGSNTGIILNGGNSSTVTANGAIVSVTGGNLKIADGASLEDGTTKGNGGAVYVGTKTTGEGTTAVTTVGSVTMAGGTLKNNSAENGGAVYVEDGTGKNGNGTESQNPTFFIQNGTITGNNATSKGSAVYVDGPTTTDGTNGGKVVMTGGSITGNTVDNNTGAVEVGGTDAKLSFSGDAKVYDNIYTTTISDNIQTVTTTYQANILLDVDPTSILQAGTTSTDNNGTTVKTGLGADARIGVNLTGAVDAPTDQASAYRDYGQTTQNFATTLANISGTNNVAAFSNDRNANLHGEQGTDGKVHWTSFVCKIVDGNGTEHPFTSLNEALTYARENMNGTAKIEMLTDYTMPAGDTLDIGVDTVNGTSVTDNITITTAKKDGNSIYKYQGTGNTATITRGSDIPEGTSMITQTGGTLNFSDPDTTYTDGTNTEPTGIILDGGDIKTSANGSIVNVTGGTLNIKDGAVLQNADTTKGDGNTTGLGGAVYVGKNATNGTVGTVNLETGAVIGDEDTTDTTDTGNKAKKGGAIYVDNGSVGTNPTLHPSLNMSGGTISGNTADTGGSAVYVDADSTNGGSRGSFHMSGGSITNNKGSYTDVNTVVGAVQVGGVNATLTFTGSPVVKDNTGTDTNGATKNLNVVLDQDSKDVIHAGDGNAQVEKDAHIGVYVTGDPAVTNSIYDKHGEYQTNLGSSTADPGAMEAFKNDVDPLLYGKHVTVTTGNTTEEVVQWTKNVAMLTDNDNNILYKNVGTDQNPIYEEALYDDIQDAFEGAETGDTQKLFKLNDSGEYEAYGNSAPVKVQLLSDVEMADGDEVNFESDRPITLTTAHTNPDNPADPHAYHPKDGATDDELTKATITKKDGSTGTAPMFTFSTGNTVTVDDVIVDGNSDGGATTGGAFRIVDKITTDSTTNPATTTTTATTANFMDVTIENVKNANATNSNGGAIYMETTGTPSGSTPSLSLTGVEITNCEAVNGGGVYIADDTTPNDGNKVSVVVNPSMDSTDTTKVDNPTTISNCQANGTGPANGKGAAIYVGDNVTTTLSGANDNGDQTSNPNPGVVITGNTTPKNDTTGGAVNIGSTTVKDKNGNITSITSHGTLSVKGNVKISDNTGGTNASGTTGAEKNVVLDVPSSDIIHITPTGLGANADLGIYPTNEVIEKVGIDNKPFATFDNDKDGNKNLTNADKLSNDRNGALTVTTQLKKNADGTTVTDANGKDVYEAVWTQKTAKLVGEIMVANNVTRQVLLYTDEKGHTPAVYDTLKDAFDNTKDGVILWYKDADGKMQQYIGGTETEPEQKPIQVQLLKDTELEQPITLNSNRDITVTTASTDLTQEMKDMGDYYTYKPASDSSNSTKATITNGQTTNITSMITVNAPGKTVKIDDLILDGNDKTTSGNGGAINVTHGNVTVEDSVLQNFTVQGDGVQTGIGAGGKGGAIYVGSGNASGNTGNDPTLTIKDTAIIGNEAVAGGGVYVETGTSTNNPTVTLKNATIAENEADSSNNTSGTSSALDGKGGGIYVSPGAVLNMNDTSKPNNTVAGNSSTGDGAGIYLAEPTTDGIPGAQVKLAGNPDFGGTDMYMVYPNADSATGEEQLIQTLKNPDGSITQFYNKVNGSTTETHYVKYDSSTNKVIDLGTSSQNAYFYFTEIDNEGRIAKYTLDTKDPDHPQKVYESSGEEQIWYEKDPADGKYYRVTKNADGTTTPVDTKTEDGVTVKVPAAIRPILANYKSTLTKKTNGQYPYPQERQDIFVAGCDGTHTVNGKEEPIPATSVVITGPMSSEAGSIWVWGDSSGTDEENNHYKMLTQFAVFDPSLVQDTGNDAYLDVLTEAEINAIPNYSSMDDAAKAAAIKQLRDAKVSATLAAFRNAQDDTTTGCGADYLTGQQGELVTVDGQTYMTAKWTGGFDVEFNVYNGFGEGLAGAEFKLYDPKKNTNIANLTDAYQKGGTDVIAQSSGYKLNEDGTVATETDSSGNTVPVLDPNVTKGVTKFDKVPTGMWYLKESNDDSTDHPFPKTTVDGEKITWKDENTYVVLVGSKALTRDENDDLWKSGVLSNITQNDITRQIGTGEDQKDFAIFRIDPTTGKAVPVVDRDETNLIDAKKENERTAAEKARRELFGDAPDVNTYGLMSSSTKEKTVILSKVNEQLEPLEGAKFTIRRMDRTVIADGLESKDIGVYFMQKLPYGTYLVEETEVSDTSVYVQPKKYFVFNVTPNGVENLTDSMVKLVSESDNGVYTIPTSSSGS